MQSFEDFISMGKSLGFHLVLWVSYRVLGPFVFTVDRRLHGDICVCVYIYIHIYIYV